MRLNLFFRTGRVDGWLIVIIVRTYKILATIGLPVLRYLGMNTMKNIMLTYVADVIEQ